MTANALPQQGAFFIQTCFDLYRLFTPGDYTEIIKSQKENFIMMGFGLLFMLALITLPIVVILALMGKLGNKNKS